MTKKTTTPTSRRAVKAPSDERKSTPVMNATCVTSTASAATARKPSKHGNRTEGAPTRAALSRLAASVTGADASAGPCA